MRDEIVRIILEAKDKLSGVVRNAEKNVHNSLENMRDDLRNLDKDNDNFSNHWSKNLNKADKSTTTFVGNTRRRLRELQDSLSKTRSDFEKTNIAFNKVERGPGGRFVSVRQREEQLRRGFGVPGGQIGPREQSSSNILRQEIQETLQQIRRSPVGRSISSFKQGIRESSDIEKEIRLRVASTDEEIKKRKQQVRDEIQDKRDALARLDSIEREQLARRQHAEEIQLQKKIRENKEAANREQDLRDERVARRSEKIRKRNDKEEFDRAKQLILDEREITRRVDKEIFDREKQRDKDIEAVKESTKLTADEKKYEIREIKQAYKEEFKDRRAARKQEIADLREGNIQINRENLASRNADIKKLEDANARVRSQNSKELDKENREKLATAQEAARIERNQLNASLRQTRTAVEQKFRDTLRGIGKPGQEADLVAELRRTRAEEQASRRDTDKLSYAFHGLGNAFGDVSRGFRRGRSAIRDVDKAARAADNGFARFGQTIGRFTRNIGQLVNLRWYLLISAFQILGQLVVVLGANLISLASSAAIAAGALGTGLLSALSQALPVAGLLAAVLNRVTAAWGAAQQATKANATSGQDARAQAEAQRNAQQGLTDALYNQIQAVKSLAEARRQARRDIVDAIFAERDANLSLKEAQFAVLDAEQRLYDLEHQQSQNKQDLRDEEDAVREAKERLKVAKQEGDQAEIEAAQVQLATAQQNLADIKNQQADVKRRDIQEAKLAVQRAKLQEQESKVAAQRQREDTKRTVKEGVRGNQQVIDALHGVATANRDVANAQRQVVDAQKHQLSGANLLQRQLSQLDPAERKLYQAFRDIRKEFKATFRPITDIIVNSITGAIRRVEVVLRKPQLLNAFRGLATAIAKGITDLSKFFTSQGFINSFVDFIHQATRNIPTLIKIIENLVKAFLGLAKAGEPVVRDILGRVANFTGKFAKSVNSPATGTLLGQQARPHETKAQQFIAGAKTYLDNWIKLADAIGRVFKYLFLDTAPSGNSLVVAMTRMFNNLADFLRDNPQKVHSFFQRMFNDLKTLAGVLFPVTKVLLSAFTGDQATEFTKFTAQVVLPGIAILIKFLGVLAKVALFLTHLPVLGPFAKLALQILVAEKAINKIFPATQKLTDALKKMVGWLLFKGDKEVSGLTIIRRRFENFVVYIRRTVIPALISATEAVAKFVWELAVSAATAMKNFAKAVAENVIAAFRTMVLFITETLIPALSEMAIAMYASLGPWGLIAAAVVAVIAVIVLLLRHFHLLKPVIHAIGDAFKAVYNWIKNNWKKILGWLIYPFKEAWKGVQWLARKIEDIFLGVINWIKNHWKGLAQILIAIFLPGGLIIAAIWKWHDQILKIAGKIVHGIWDWFKKLPHLIVEALSALPKLLIKLFKDVGKKIFNGIFGFLPGPIKSALSKAFHIGGDIVGGIEGGAKSLFSHFDSGGIIGSSGKRGEGPHGTDTVKAWLTPGEWVLNKTQQIRLAHKIGATADQVANFLFGPRQHMGQSRTHDSAKGANKVHHGGRRGAMGAGRSGGAFPFDLVAETDDDGNVVYFIGVTNGQYLQLSTKDAKHVIKAGGSWVPKWIHNHGFTVKRFKNAANKVGAYAMGGIVMPQQSYSMGGVLTSPQSSYSASSIKTIGGNTHHKKIEQNFKVHTQGETDWNYVMRLAAMKAQEAF